MKKFNRQVSIKVYCLFLLITINLGAIAQIDCNTPNRYREDILTNQEIDTFSLVYANYVSSQIWNNADTINNTTCFDPRGYLTALPNGTWDIRMKVYQPSQSIDQCLDRASIIFVHGGGYAYLATGIETAGVTDHALMMARKGYVVITINYRKGWDIRDAKNVTGLGPLLPGCQTCPCEDGNSNCDPFSFTKMNYMMMQDTRAAHRKLLTIKDNVNVDEDKIFYLSSSTGSVGAMHAAYAADDFGSFQSPDGTPIDQILGLPDDIGVPTPANANFSIAGIAAHAGAIHDLDWIENADEVPLCMIHSTLDEAVLYCAGNILQMKYFTPSSGTYLTLQGAGKIYKNVYCNSEGTNTKSKMRLHSFQGLYHNMCSPLGSSDPSDNCDTINSAEKLFGFYARFYADVIESNGINNQHMLAANAHTQNQCNVVDSNTYTPCTGFVPCPAVSLHEEEESGSILVYPNQLEKGSYLHFEHELNDEIIGVRVYDIFGRNVLEQINDLEDQKIRIPLPSGVYYVYLIFNQKTYTQKIIVK